MTREQALEKIPQLRWYSEDGQRGWLLDSLRELGLISFDGPKNRREKFETVFMAKGYHANSVGLQEALQAFDESEK